MELAKAGIVAGERKAVASFQSRWREIAKAAACLKASIQPVEKAPVEELKGKASGALDRTVPCRACRRGTRLQIRSLGTIFFFGGDFQVSGAPAKSRQQAEGLPHAWRCSV